MGGWMDIDQQSEDLTAKIGFKDKAKLAWAFTRMGIKLGKDQVDMAIDGLTPILKVTRLSQEANQCIYERKGKESALKSDADWNRAYSLIGEARTLCQQQIDGFTAMGQLKVADKIRKDQLEVLNGQEKLLIMLENEEKTEKLVNSAASAHQ